MATKFLLALVVTVFTLLSLGGIGSFYPDFAPWFVTLLYPHLLTSLLIFGVLLLLLLLLWLYKFHVVSALPAQLWQRVKAIVTYNAPIVVQDRFARRWQIFLQNQQQCLTPSALRADAYTFEYDDGIGVMLMVAQDEPLTMAFMRTLLEHVLVQRYVVAVVILDQSISIGCRFFAEESGILLIDSKTFAQTYDCLQISQLALTRV